MRFREGGVLALAVLLFGCAPAERTGPQAVIEVPKAPRSAVIAPLQMQSNSCSAASQGSCRGCSISCPASRPAICGPGVNDWRPMNGGGAPICTQQAYCYCGT